MLIKSSKNRTEIKIYLNSISEDDLINDVVVPLYSSFGYSVLRVVTHGPGEHGKDLVVYKYSQAIFGNEYIAIQAKAQKVDAHNITDMANQLIRALRTPIKGLSGGSEFLPNYVVHFNSQMVTNDAHWEFPYLVDGKDNIKIISQDNVVDLMLSNDIIPQSLKSKLEMGDSNVNDSISKNIQYTLFSGNFSYIDALFENVISISKDQIDFETKHMIIEYIFKKWKEDNSWLGTVKPMKWLDDCFDFLSPNQFGYLGQVVEEYTASNPSFGAREYVCNIMDKMSIGHYAAIKDLFLKRTISDYRKNSPNSMKRRFLEFVSKEDKNNVTALESRLKDIFEQLDSFHYPLSSKEECEKYNSLNQELLNML